MSWGLIERPAITNFIGLTELKSCENVGNMLVIPITL